MCLRNSWCVCQRLAKFRQIKNNNWRFPSKCRILAQWILCYVSNYDKCMKTGFDSTYHIEELLWSLVPNYDRIWCRNRAHHHFLAELWHALVPNYNMLFVPNNGTISCRHMAHFHVEERRDFVPKYGTFLYRIMAYFMPNYGTPCFYPSLDY